MYRTSLKGRLESIELFFYSYTIVAFEVGWCQKLTLAFFCTLQMEMDDIVIDVNDKHMTSWGDACRRDAIHNTPLNPYLDRVGTCTPFLNFVMNPEM